MADRFFSYWLDEGAARLHATAEYARDRCQGIIDAARAGDCVDPEGACWGVVVERVEYRDREHALVRLVPELSERAASLLGDAAPGSPHGDLAAALAEVERLRADLSEALDHLEAALDVDDESVPTGETMARLWALVPVPRAPAGVEVVGEVVDG